MLGIIVRGFNSFFVVGRRVFVRLFINRWAGFDVIFCVGVFRWFRIVKYGLVFVLVVLRRSRFAVLIADFIFSFFLLL